MVPQKLNQVMKAVTALSKDGKMQAQNYEYLSEEKVTTELHKAFADAGLVIRPLAMEIIGERENANGWQFVRILATYQLNDADEKEEPAFIVQAIGEGADKGDKACNKAMTAAYKYALRQTCMISTGDDPDHESSEAQAKPAAKPAPKNGGDGGNAKPVAYASIEQKDKLKAAMAEHFAGNNAEMNAFIAKHCGAMTKWNAITAVQAVKMLSILGGEKLAAPEEKPTIKNPGKPASEKQLGLLRKLRNDHLGGKSAAWDAMCQEKIGRVCPTSEMTMGEASTLIDAINNGESPHYQGQEALPVDNDEPDIWEGN